MENETEMSDIVIKTGRGSIIQHGKLNDRIYLIKMREADFPWIIGEMNRLARENSYSKIFCKVPDWALPEFKSDGYITEAHVPGYSQGRDDYFFVSKFLSSDRLMEIETDRLAEMGDLIKNNRVIDDFQGINDFEIGRLDQGRAKEVSRVMSRVFATYPFPVHDPLFIRESMEGNTEYFGALDNRGNLVAVSSAEIDTEYENAEMTDFAILPDYRGKRLSLKLLSGMEKYLKGLKVKTLYTIARLNSMPMNKTFLKLGYRYTGTLIKNTNISGKIESMNVLYKSVK